MFNEKKFGRIVNKQFLHEIRMQLLDIKRAVLERKLK